MRAAATCESGARARQKYRQTQAVTGSHRQHALNASSLNAYSHTLAPISHLSAQSRAKGKATISRGVEPADHKVSRRRVADCTGAREYLVEGTVVRMLPRRIQIQSQQPIGRRQLCSSANR